MDTQELQKLKNKYDIIGNDVALNNALEMAVAVAPTDLIVLVTGESGVGKENIPKIIHQNSLRKTGKYFAVNCGAIPEGTIESELFGHEKGSFTGAIEARKGYFEEANGGTIFLDEIGELPLPYQAKLLRVLQSGEYTRVGSSKVNKTYVRVIAATNKDLRYAVAQGKFREDLYYRINGVQIKMPSLRERKDDIYLFFRKFVSDFAEKYNLRRISLTHDAIELLRNYRWPGNIRQLKNISETVAALESAGMIPGADRIEINASVLSGYIPKDDPNSLPVRLNSSEGSISDSDRQEIFKALYSLNSEVANIKKIISAGGYPQSPAAPQHNAIPEPDGYVSRPHNDWAAEGNSVDIQDDKPNAYDIEINKNIVVPAESSLSLKDAKDDLIRKALEKHDGNRKKAAEELGISERTLYRRLPDEFKKQK